MRPHTQSSKSRSLLHLNLAALGALLMLSSAIAQTQALASPPGAGQAVASAASIRYRVITVDGLELFYREAGPADAPVILLLHGFPASSFMYRDLMDRLAGQYRVVAPDYPGFGYSSAPSRSDFEYSFDRLADVMEQFTDQLGLKQYVLYMQDFGGPVGFRLAERRPGRVTALVVQNANAYAEGLPDSFWAPARKLWADPSARNFAMLRDAAMSDEALEWNYRHGTQDPARINPDSWMLQRSLLGRPGNKEIMLDLLYDYRKNLGQYPRWHAYFRKHQPPTLIIWGRNDVIFPPVGAQAYARDLPKAELHLLDTGHFALEEKSEEITALMKAFLSRPR